MVLAWRIFEVHSINSNSHNDHLGLCSCSRRICCKERCYFRGESWGAVFVIVVPGILFFVVGLSQTIIPFIRGLNTPFSPESGAYSAIIGFFMIAGLVFLGTLLLHRGLRISRMELVPEQFDGQRGFRVNALVENYDKRVIYDLSAQIAVTGSELQLLRVERHEDDGHSCSVHDLGVRWT